MTVSIETQLAEVERELKLRETHYPKWVESGKADAAVAEARLAAMRAAAATLRMVATHAGGLRALIKFLRNADFLPGETPSPQETEWMLAQPGVKELVAAFPDGELSIWEARQTSPQGWLEEVEDNHYQKDTD